MPTDQVIEALRASLLDNQRLRQENRRLAHASREPVAVVAMSCRYPVVSAPRKTCGSCWSRNATP
nr:polyketide synthase docking domain-containing protein [Streptomyces clavuligerus]